MEVTDAIQIGVSTAQIKLLTELAASLSPSQPQQGLSKKGRKKGGGSKKKGGGATVAAAPAAEDSRSAILTELMRTHSLSHFVFSGSIVGGINATLFGMAGMAGQPLAPTMPLVAADVKLISEGLTTSQNQINVKSAIELLHGPVPLNHGSLSSHVQAPRHRLSRSVAVYGVPSLMSSN